MLASLRPLPPRSPSTRKPSEVQSGPSEVQSGLRFQVTAESGSMASGLPHYRSPRFRLTVHSSFDSIAFY
jgi:hypothetical protein